MSTDPRDYDGPFDGSHAGWVDGRKFKQFLQGSKFPFNTTWTEANKLARENPEKYIIWKTRRALGVKDEW